MRTILLTVVFAAAVSGAAYADGSALTELKSNMSISLSDSNSLKTLKAENIQPQAGLNSESKSYKPEKSASSIGVRKNSPGATVKQPTTKKSEAYCNQNPYASGCESSEAYCKLNPYASTCGGSEAYCNQNPYAPGCESSEAYCKLNPYASSCASSEAYCSLHPDASTCSKRASLLFPNKKAAGAFSPLGPHG
ncbi:MAG: hypothetical protein Q7R35_06480 [Elusimicrobiota bacterium]|nr:hypothetical protein [Elusimicrobiota bacterium]